jgi:hypothetical protein
MDSTATSIGKTLVLNFMAGSSIFSPLYYQAFENNDPVTKTEYISPFTSHEWENRLSYGIVIAEHLDFAKFKIVEKFSSTLLKESKDIDEDILEIVNKNFWELL